MIIRIFSKRIDYNIRVQGVNPAEVERIPVMERRGVFSAACRRELQKYGKRRNNNKIKL